MLHCLLIPALVGLLPAFQKQPEQLPSPDRQMVYRKVGDVSLKLHIFNPKGHKPTDKTPAIVFFFGGGWVGGTPTQFYKQCRHLADRGMVAISAEYRVKNQHMTTPRECVADGKSAIRWVRSHASKLGIDPDRIAAGGGSAGGHVAAATATVNGFDDPADDTAISCRPNALVLFNPVYDNGPSGYGHDRVKDYWQAISPMHNLGKSTPPAIVFLGTNDNLIPVATARDFQQRMQAYGQRSELVLYEGQKHGFFNKEKFQETLSAAEGFLTSLGYLPEPPSK